MPPVERLPLSFDLPPKDPAIALRSMRRIAGEIVNRLANCGPKIGLLFALAASGSALSSAASASPTPTVETKRSEYHGRLDQGMEGQVTVDATPQPGNFDEAPQPIERVTPNYPGAALRVSISGDVRLDLLVDTAGEPREPRVSISPHSEFEATAVETVLKWKFKPAMKNGQPVAARFNFVFRFKGTRADTIPGAAAFLVSGAKPWTPWSSELQYEQAPEMKLAAAAVYPFELAMKNAAGSATMVFLIDPTGRTRRIDVIESTAPEFGAAASAMVAAWRFQPAQNGRKPTWARFIYQQTFGPPKGDSVLHESAARVMEALKQNPSPILDGSGTLDTALTARYRVAPTVPEAMITAGASAEAEIEFVVDRSGRVQWPRVVSATREDFGWAAATAVARWQFAPPTQNGKPVDVRVRIPLAYEAPAKPAVQPSPR